MQNEKLNSDVSHMSRQEGTNVKPPIYACLEQLTNAEFIYGQPIETSLFPQKQAMADFTRLPVPSPIRQRICDCCWTGSLRGVEEALEELEQKHPQNQELVTHCQELLMSFDFAGIQILLEETRHG